MSIRNLDKILNPKRVAVIDSFCANSMAPRDTARSSAGFVRSKVSTLA